MKCPFCDGEMQHGQVSGDGRSGVYFIQDGKKLTLGDMLTGVGALKCDRKWMRFSIGADYCDQCRKIILDVEVGK